MVGCLEWRGRRKGGEGREKLLVRKGGEAVRNRGEAVRNGGEEGKGNRKGKGRWEGKRE